MKNEMSSTGLSQVMEIDEVEGPATGSARVRALMRGLEILRHVNRAGAISPGRLAVELGLPRATVYRLLQTLEASGYVATSSSSNLVRVTRLATELGDGNSITSDLCQAAGKIFQEYAPKVIWPLDLLVYRDGFMDVQETTHGRSPVSIDQGVLGYRLPMLRTSAGRCYLAFCSEPERAIILDHLVRRNDPEDRPFLVPGHLARMIRETKERGIGIREAGEFRAKTASFAVPVLVNDTIVGCVSLIWIRTAMKLQRALEMHEIHLHEIAQHLAHGVERARTETKGNSAGIHTTD